MSNHTKGPWHSHQNQSSPGFRIDSLGNEWQGLCKVYQAPGLENEGEANAKLIAAAPELLQALKNIISSAPITCLPLALEKDIQAACILIERLGAK